MKFVFLVAAALLLPQEKNEAEELFRKMEAKLVAAKTIQMKVKGVLSEGKVNVTVEIQVAEENRARIAAEMKFLDSTRSSQSVSDGTMILQTTTDGTRLPEHPAPESFGQLIRKCVAICGVFHVAENFLVGKAGTDPVAAYKVSTFILGPKAKIGDIETQMVQYKVTPKTGEELAVIIWVDPKTHLPLKRTVVGKASSMEETYSEIKLDEKIDSAKFELPKDK